jgi:hypothetical protein
MSVNGVPKDAGTLARALAVILDHGVTLVVGHALALAAIVVRTTWGAKARELTPA